MGRWRWWVGSGWQWLAVCSLTAGLAEAQRRQGARGGLVGLDRSPSRSWGDTGLAESVRGSSEEGTSRTTPPVPGVGGRPRDKRHRQHTQLGDNTLKLDTKNHNAARFDAGALRSCLDPHDSAG